MGVQLVVSRRRHCLDLRWWHSVADDFSLWYRGFGVTFDCCIPSLRRSSHGCERCSIPSLASYTAIAQKARADTLLDVVELADKQVAGVRARLSAVHTPQTQHAALSRRFGASSRSWIASMGSCGASLLVRRSLRKRRGLYWKTCLHRRQRSRRPGN